MKEDDDDIEERLELERIKEAEKMDNAIPSLDKIEWNLLTGCPLQEDTVFYIVPVCAPLPSIISYKYKVKLLPGPLKKGKGHF